jgi:DNA-binding MarR family transcriptional regulator
VSRKDSRIAHVYLSETGSRMLDRVDKAWLAADEDAFAGLKDKEIRRLRKLLGKIAANLGRKVAAEDE